MVPLNVFGSMYVAANCQSFGAYLVPVIATYQKIKFGKIRWTCQPTNTDCFAQSSTVTAQWGRFGYMPVDAAGAAGPATAPAYTPKETNFANWQDAISHPRFKIVPPAKTFTCSMTPKFEVTNTDWAAKTAVGMEDKNPWFTTNSVLATTTTGANFEFGRLMIASDPPQNSSISTESFIQSYMVTGVVTLYLKDRQLF